MSSPTNWMKKEYDDLVKKGFDWKPPVIGGPSTVGQLSTIKRE